MSKAFGKGKYMPFSEKAPAEVHRVQNQFRNKERSQYRKDKRNGIVLYSSLDTPEMTGEEMLPDRNSVSVEDDVELTVLSEQVRKAVDTLPPAQKWLIEALFFEGKTEKEIAQELQVSQQAISKRVRRALLNLKIFLKI